MKTKPIIIAAVAIVVLAIGAYFIFFRGKNVSSAKESEITVFLKNFNSQIKKGNRDSLLSYFAGQQNTEPVNRLVTALLNKTDKDNPEAAFNLELDIDKSGITFTNPNLAVAVIPVTFSGDHLDSKLTSLNITVQKDDDGKYKIYQIDGLAFMKDYLAYQSNAWQKNYTDKEIYSPVTLKAFADASNLYAKYDSVIWFSHIKDQTYFYVTKGKWDLGNMTDDTAKTYKMGLVGPDYKEIIPAEYDLIHNINGTFPNLVEVEKEHKKGFFDLTGKTVVPVEYDQAFPVKDPENLAALRKGDDYFWLKNDYTISEKADINIGDLFAKLKQPASFTLTNSPAGDITEFNSRYEHGSIYLPPSYLVELNLMPQIQEFKNPLRNHVMFEESSTQYIVKARSLPVNSTAATEGNWLQNAFYSVRDYFISGRSEFYETRRLVLIDKKHNKFYAQSVSIDNSRGGEYEGLSGPCNEYNFRTLTDSLFELKVSSVSQLFLYDDKEVLQEMPMYHYFTLKNDKLTEMTTGRAFAFTKYLKMDDSYLQGCYTYRIYQKTYPWKQRQSYQLTPQVLQYMKNEIYADYGYKFKDKKWNEIFYDSYGDETRGKNESVQDSLTEIDKYNIQWIDQKLKSKPVIKKNTLALNN